jgi:excisionase family DNA binding protein
MNRRPAPVQPRRGSTPAAERAVRPQASRPEPGPPAERMAYSVDEAARLTGLSRDLLYDEMRRGHLGYIKIGRRRLITRQHLERFLGITSALQPPILSSTTKGRKASEDGY